MEIHHFMIELGKFNIQDIISTLKNVGKHIEVSENIHVFINSEFIVYITVIQETLFLDVLARNRERGLKIVKNIVKEAQMQKTMTHYVYRGF